ncbi:hypothetical protein BESB_013650 [Besnoitia besnoiti]|uniref:J domain-containing protein n=1 Tax=Besnoitia besnoiti TaxID=94643 RepID=A0A2A9MAN0_BESBE|nr:hypothetical protein BESB_013650 [Besnoitia besnoiti]PFH32753.1 hypothetical protein BESB_013650 [Besnoitia besnoiti]
MVPGDDLLGPKVAAGGDTGGGVRQQEGHESDGGDVSNGPQGLALDGGLRRRTLRRADASSLPAASSATAAARSGASPFSQILQESPGGSAAPAVPLPPSPAPPSTSPPASAPTSCSPSASSRSASNRLRGLSRSSPFRLRSRIFSFFSVYFSFFFGGCFGLHWRHLGCWARWCLRVLTFSALGVHSFFDFFRLPGAVRAFNRQQQQAFVRDQLIDRLKKAHRKNSQAAARAHVRGASPPAPAPDVSEPPLPASSDAELENARRLLAAIDAAGPDTHGEVDPLARRLLTLREDQDALREQTEALRRRREMLEAQLAQLRATFPLPAAVSLPPAASPAPAAAVSTSPLPSLPVSRASSSLTSLFAGASPSRRAVTEADLSELLRLQSVEPQICSVPPRAVSHVAGVRSGADKKTQGAQAAAAATSRRSFWSWWALVPWSMMARGFYAHVLCCYVVDVAFCNAELSPLSAPVPRYVFLLLHALARALAVFAANFSSLPRLPLHVLCSAFFFCVTTSCGAAAALLALPELSLVVAQYAPALHARVFAPVAAMFREGCLTLESVDAKARLPFALRDDFYVTGQLVALVLVAVSAFVATEAREEAAGHWRRGELSYCRDVLALLALLDREEREAKARRARLAATPQRAADAEKSWCARRLRAEAPGDSHQPPVKGGKGTTRDHAAEAGEPQEEREEEPRSAGVRAEGPAPQTGGGDTRDASGALLSTLGTAEAKAEEFEEDWRLTSLVAQAQQRHRAQIQQGPRGAFAGWLRRHAVSFLVGVCALVFLLVWLGVVTLAASNVAMRMEDQTAAKVFTFMTGGDVSVMSPELEQLKEEFFLLYDQFRYLKRQKGWGGALGQLATMFWREIEAALSERDRKKKKADDAYSLLGIEPSASAKEIKRAYKNLARQIHPDVIAASSPEPLTAYEEAQATERMRKINEAYERLMRVHGGRGNTGRD